MSRDHEVAILGVVRSKMSPVWNGTEFVPRNMLPISLSYDHRVIDGALAARFARHLCTLLEDDRPVLEERLEKDLKHGPLRC